MSTRIRSHMLPALPLQLTVDESLEPSRYIYVKRNPKNKSNRVRAADGKCWLRRGLKSAQKGTCLGDAAQHCSSLVLRLLLPLLPASLPGLDCMPGGRPDSAYRL